MSTPAADELRQAAATLRKLARRATEDNPTPWHSSLVSDGWEDEPYIPTLTDDDGQGITPPPYTEEAARWMALMSPEVAEPLASWLDGEANRGDWHAEYPRAAFMFARLISRKAAE